MTVPSHSRGLPAWIFMERNWANKERMPEALNGLSGLAFRRSRREQPGGRGAHMGGIAAAVRRLQGTRPDTAAGLHLRIPAARPRPVSTPYVAPCPACVRYPR
jgi:hypothetical protein